MDVVRELGVIFATPSSRQTTTHQTVEAAILAIFSDDVKAAIRKRIEAMQWLGEPGPPIAERPALIAKAENEIKNLEEQLYRLRSEAAAAGIVL